MKKTLELPETLRVPDIHEVPNDASIIERLRKRADANIVEGYTLKLKDDNPDNKDLPFEFYAEINVNNSKLWQLFLELTNLMPDEVSLISGHIDADASYGNYTDRLQAIEFLSIYKNEFITDVFIDFGLIHHTDKVLIEVFVDSSKYIQFWGINIEIFKATMQRFGLFEIENLEFVDEYPKVRTSLAFLDNTVTNTNELLELLKNHFK